MSTLSFLLNNDWAPIALGTAVSVAYAITVKKFLVAARERRRAEEKRFINALRNGLVNGKLTQFSEVENLFKGIRKSSSNDEFSKTVLAKWLRLAYVENVESDDKDSKSKLNEKSCQSLTNFLKSAETAAPYAGLPELERNILKDLDSFVRNNSSSDAKRKIEEISSAIQIREDSLQKVQSTIKWSVPLSIVGVVLTFIFGLVSIFK